MRAVVLVSLSTFLRNADGCSLHRMLAHSNTSQALDLLHSHPSDHDEVPQFPCGMQATLEEKVELEKSYDDWKVQHQHRNLCDDYFEIPVYLNVFKPDANTGHLRRKEADALIAKLNYGFRDTPFHFVLKRVRRVVNGQYATCQGNFKSRYHVPRKDALSIYLCDLIGTRQVVGLTYTPASTVYFADDDGITFTNPALATGEPNNDMIFYSNVLIHEVGHWVRASK